MNKHLKLGRYKKLVKYIPANRIGNNGDDFMAWLDALIRALDEI